MNSLPSYQPERARGGPIALTIALHVALLLTWKLGPAVRVPDVRAAAARWFLLTPERPRAPRVPVAATPVAAAHAIVRQTPQRPAPRAMEAARTPMAGDAPARPTTPGPVPSEPAIAVLAKPDATVPDELMAAPSAPAPGKIAELIGQTRYNVGKIDRELRKDAPAALQAPADTRMSRLAAGIEGARPKPKWNEAARIEEITDQSGSGKRIYKVITAFGTYCAIYQGNNTAHAIDDLKYGNKPLLVKCPTPLRMR